MMNTKINSEQEFELMTENQLKYQLDRLNLGNWFNHICEALIHSIIHASEPSIEQVIDQKGHIHWHISDPVTRQTFYCSSESEVRIWLERRYALK